MKEIVLLFPEIILVLALIALIVAEIGYHGERMRLIAGTALLGLGSALIEIFITSRTGSITLFNGALSINGLSYYFKLYFIISAILVVLVSSFSDEIAEKRRTEYYAFIVGITVGLCILSSATDLILIFLSFQLINALGYFLAGYAKQKLFSTEAAVKYFIFSAVSAAFFLYAVAILYSFAHTVNINEMHNILSVTPLPMETGLVVFILLFISLGFYLGTFPMQMWVPDVLEGAPTPTTLFFSLCVPAVGFSVGLRLFLTLFASPGSDKEMIAGFNWTNVVGFVSGITMILGSVLAIRQKAAKRMLACLVVAQAGFLLMTFLVLNRGGVSALLFNLIVSMLSLVGVFLALTHIFNTLRSDKMVDFSGFMTHSMPECISLLMFLGCFVGLPPFPGFIGKFIMIGAAVREQWYVLAAIAVISGVFAIAAFAKLAFSLSGTPRGWNESQMFPVRKRRIFIIVLLIPVFLLSAFADRVLYWTSESLQRFLW